MSSHRTKFQHVFTRTDNKKKNITFYYEVSLGTDPITGKRLKVKSCKDINGNKFTCAKDAYKEVTRVLYEYQQNDYQTDSKMPFKQYSEQEFIPDYKLNVRASTFNTKQHLFKILMERFGNTPLNKITRRDIRHFKIFLLENSNYGTNYAATILSTLGQILDFAVSNDDLYRNVALNISITKTKPAYIHWSHEEVKRVLLQIDKNNYFNHLVYAMIHFYFYTGVRVNEATATHWSDIDFDKKTIHINQMLIKEKGKKPYRQNYTKTDAGDRIIPLDSYTIEILKELRERQKNDGINSDFIFSDTGKPLYSQRVAKKMKEFAEKAGIKPIPLQKLRNSNAMYLYYDLGIHPKDIKQLFGHEDESTLFRYYIEKRNIPNIEVAQKIEDSINTSLHSDME